MKNKLNWTEIKEKIINALKLIIMVITMVVGFWAIYLIIWTVCGLTQNVAITGGLLALALFSECLFLLWLNN